MLYFSDLRGGQRFKLPAKDLDRQYIKLNYSNSLGDIYDCMPYNAVNIGTGGPYQFAAEQQVICIEGPEMEEDSEQCSATRRIQ